MHPRFRTPHIAILAGGVVGIAAIFSDQWISFGGQPLTANIVTMSVFGAIVMYIVSMASLFKLRAPRARDWRGRSARRCTRGSPASALAAAVVCLATMVYYNLLIAGLFVALGVLGGVYFALTPKLRERADAVRSREPQ